MFKQLCVAHTFVGRSHKILDIYTKNKNKNKKKAPVVVKGNEKPLNKMELIGGTQHRKRRKEKITTRVEDSFFLFFPVVSSIFLVCFYLIVSFRTNPPTQSHSLLWVRHHLSSLPGFTRFIYFFFLLSRTISAWQFFKI